MKKHLPIVAFLAAALLTGSARAQITWSLPSAITGVPDIATNGSYLDAVQTSTNPNFTKSVQTIGDTTFNIENPNGTGVEGSGPGFITLLNTNTTGFLGSFTSSPPSSPAYADVLLGCAFIQGGTGVVSLSGLTSGDQYQVEIWNSTTLSTTFTGANTVTLAGNDFALGTFTASAVPETFTFGVGPGGFGVITAIAVRDISEVPEPSTWAMMLGGMGFLVLLARRNLLRA